MKSSARASGLEGNAGARYPLGNEELAQGAPRLVTSAGRVDRIAEIVPCEGGDGCGTIPRASVITPGVGCRSAACLAYTSNWFPDSGASTFTSIHSSADVSANVRGLIARSRNPDAASLVNASGTWVSAASAVMVASCGRKCPPLKGWESGAVGQFSRVQGRNHRPGILVDGYCEGCTDEVLDAGRCRPK